MNLANVKCIGDEVVTVGAAATGFSSAPSDADYAEVFAMSTTSCRCCWGGTTPTANNGVLLDEQAAGNVLKIKLYGGQAIADFLAFGNTSKLYVVYYRSRNYA